MPPNILLIMADEHAPQFSGPYGHPMVRTPNMNRLAESGVTFEAAYCNSPLCLPSRMSFMTGQYVHKIGAYDNAVSLPSDTVTWAHLLRSVGYDTVLSGKQHFVGCDQLHGFAAQMSRDLHAEMTHPIWDWDGLEPPPTEPWAQLASAGMGVTEEIRTDDAAEQAALNYLRDPARAHAPWALNVGFIAPHFPFVAPEPFWSMYAPERIDLPSIPGPLPGEHPAYQSMREHFGLAGGFPENQVRLAKVGYYALISYLDEKIGRLLSALKETGQADNTIVIYTADHGEMAGELGMWRKSTFREQSVRVPLLVSWPGTLPAGRRVHESVSLVDLAASMITISGADPVTMPVGDDLLPLAAGRAPEWKDEAFSEYLAHAVSGPTAMLRKGRYKFIYHHRQRPELFDMETDPEERNELIGAPEYASTLDRFRSELLTRWNPEQLDTAVRHNQRERLLIRSVTKHAVQSEEHNHMSE